MVIPVFNVDGHEDFSPYHRPSQNGPKSTGLRATAQRVNLNRDYIKARHAGDARVAAAVQRVDAGFSYRQSRDRRRGFSI